MERWKKWSEWRDVRRREAEEEDNNILWHRLTLDLWLAKDNRFLNPKSSYKRILMAPSCRFIHRSRPSTRAHFSHLPCPLRGGTLTHGVNDEWKKCVSKEWARRGYVEGKGMKKSEYFHIFWYQLLILTFLLSSSLITFIVSLYLYIFLLQ